MNDSLHRSDLHFFQEMRTLSSSNSKKTQTLSVTDQRAINQVMIGQWRGAKERIVRAREIAIGNYWKIRFSSNDHISATKSRLEMEQEVFYRGKFTLSDDFNFICTFSFVLQQRLFKFVVILIDVARIFKFYRNKCVYFSNNFVIIALLIVFILIRMQSYVYF